jgi:uncharacterized membrane protein YfcA
MSNYLAFGIIFHQLDVPRWQLCLLTLFVGQQVGNWLSHKAAERHVRAAVARMTKGSIK